MREKRNAPAEARAKTSKSLSERKTSEDKGTKNQRLDKIITENLGGCISAREVENILLLQKYVTIFCMGFTKALSDGKVMEKRVNITDLRRISDRAEIIIADGTYCRKETDEVRRAKEAWKL